MEDDLVVRVEAAPDATVIAVRGELDMATCERLWAVLEEFVASGRRTVLDCDELAFTDARGLSVIVRAHHRAVAAGGGLELVNLRRQPRQVIELTGLRGVLSVRQRQLSEAAPGS
jgi:anti-sigma B factor antagonist